MGFPEKSGNPIGAEYNLFQDDAPISNISNSQNLFFHIMLSTGRSVRALYLASDFLL